MITLRDLLFNMIRCLHHLKPDTDIICENGVRRFKCCKRVINFGWEDCIDPTLYDKHDQSCSYRSWIEMKKHVDNIINLLGIQ